MLAWGELSPFPARHPISGPGRGCSSGAPGPPKSRGAFSPQRCSFPGGGRGQGHPEVLEINAGHPVRPARKGEQGLPGHPSSNSDGGSIWAVASSVSANEGATWLLVNEGPSFCLPPFLPSSLPNPSSSLGASVQEGRRCPAGGGRLPAPQQLCHPHPFTDTPCSNVLEPKGFPDLSSLYLTLKAILGGC